METSLTHSRWTAVGKHLRILVSIMTVFIMIAPDLARADDRYWVGQGGTLNDWHDTNNWGASFTAVSGGSSVPGIGDEAFFDENAEGNTVTIRDNVAVKGIRIGAQYTGRILAYSGARIRVGSGGIKMGSGHVMLGSGTNLVISGSFTQTGGVFGNGFAANQLVLSGNLMVYRRARFRFSGTILFEGVANQTMYFSGSYLDAAGADIAAGKLRFSGVILNSVGAATADNLTVSGTVLKLRSLTVTNGTLDVQSRDVPLVLSGSLTIADDADASFDAEENITMSGSITTGASGRFYMSGGTLTLNGIEQRIDLSGVGSQIHTMIMKSSGSFTATALITAALTITGSNTMSIATSARLNLTGGTLVNYGTILEETGVIVHTGSAFRITDSSYNEDAELKSAEIMYFTLTDSDENITGGTADTVTITVTGNSTAGSDSETVTLTETTLRSGVFRGEINTEKASKTLGDNKLQIAAEGVVTATYTDAQDGLSNADTILVQAIGSSSSTNTNSGGGSSRSNAAGGGGGGGGGGKIMIPVKAGIKKVPDRVVPKKKMKSAAERRAERLEKAKKAKETRAARAAQRKAKK